jgi:type I restriction enzyme S subunit
MTGEWQELPFADAPLEIIDGDRGSNYPKLSDFSSSGHCLFLNAGNVTINGFNLSDCSFVDQGKDDALRKGKLQRDDIVLTTRGTVGNVALYDESIPYEHIRLNSGMVILRADKEALLPRFLYLFLRSRNFKDQVASLTTGSAQPQLPIRDMRRVELSLPPLDEQRAIAHILGTLDDKIELNRKMNQTLEAMARAIFKSWFVDFDPVRAKSEGRNTGLPPDLTALFPDSFEDSELGEIPKGWTSRPFSEIVRIISGGTPKTAVAEYWDGNIPWFSVVDAPDDGDVYAVNTDKMITQSGLDNSAAQLLPEGTTIITARGTVGKVALVGSPMAMNQSCYGLLGIESGPAFTYFATRTLVSILKRHGHGSIFNTITRDTLAGVNFVSPPKRILEAFEPVVAPMMQRIKSNLIESRTLIALRDMLLPKLLSGEIGLQNMGAGSGVKI